jgi:predicted transcriptional regulator
MEDFAKYLYRLRMRRGKYISQQKLSELSGYTQPWISMIETGKVRPSKRCMKALVYALSYKKTVTTT